ncbi:hypothetical protein Xcel_2348 [Xylanimonas cellulosilytica DSM 15894]|uniref:Uncharacterized protein n=1 Tax=Xylanimonas cellulosilytica (strain DSM 15894 / JCM 12276 / CECT 5975 / KCTC 9989 / LMG 20990 / NBRC 107835 / XIL07) TaxID=446471 RepID=D1BVP5_XYLCX|nr:hypothetical protein [Xylanimonas cellulosilytica]ACZ31364.1 hypothetical protein Xcel_2348 [Xylanimonas cellulosilytica DSM 15894]
MSGARLPDEFAPGPVNWNELGPGEAAEQWCALDAWVTWLRRSYGISTLEIPPFWHRHDELVWELSALRQHWLACYSDGASLSAPIQWHRDFADARKRLRDWVAACGTSATSDRPTLVPAWPGDDLDATDVGPDRILTDRTEDFRAVVNADIAYRDAVLAANVAVLDMDGA